MKQQLVNYILRLSTCIFIIQSTGAYAQWNTIYTTTVTSTLYPYQINYTKDSAIFVSAKKDFIYSKNNGGSFVSTNSFVTIPTVSSYDTYREFADISFATKDTGSIAGFSYIGGYNYPFTQNSTGTFSSWNLNHPITPNASLYRINTIKHFKNQKVYAFDNNTNLYYSSDGGSSWILKNTIVTSTGAQGIAMSLIDEQTGYFATGKGIYKTTDGGLTFNFLLDFPSSYLYNIKKIRFRDINNGYIIAQNGFGECKLFKTIDGGNNWQDVFQGTLPDILIDVSFPTADTGFVATSNYILQTFNGGIEWYIQRYPNMGFTEIEFIDKNEGVAVAKPTNGTLKILKYIPNSISNKPFALFNFQPNYCCSGQICNIINYGSSNWTYKWYLNNVLSSTAFIPSSLILPSVGTHTIKLVASNGTNKDSVSRTVYNAGVFSGINNFNISLFDTTICYGSQAYLQIGNSNSQLSYAAFSNSIQITPWRTGGSGNIAYNTSPLTFNDSIITIRAVSGYSNCVGNSFSKIKNIKVLPLPSSTLMSLLSDSICYQESAKMMLAPCTKGTTYSVKRQNNTTVHTFTAPTGSSYYYDLGSISNSLGYYYSAIDSNGCSITTSPLLKVKVDSMWVELQTLFPATLPGDTLILKNTSVATNYMWNYSSGTHLLSNNDSVVKLKYAALGDYYIRLYAENKTGCKDSLLYHISVYNNLNQGSGQLTCFSDTTAVEQNLNRLPRSSYYMLTNNYHRFHTDIYENYYLAENNYLFGTDPNYGGLHFKLYKYDSNGILKWTVMPNFSSIALGPSGHYVYTTVGSVSSDKKGNIYITGNFRGRLLKIGNVSRYFNNPNSNGLVNAFITKIDSNGNCKWILAMEKNNGGYSYPPASIGALSANHQDAIYFKADFVTNAVFTNTIINTLGDYSYLMVIDSLGNFKRMSPLYNSDYGQGSFYSVNFTSGNSSDIFNYEDKMIRFKDKLIHYAYTTRPSVQLFGGNIINAASVPGYVSCSLMSYVIITDTMGNLLNYFKPAVLYDSLINNSNIINYSYLSQYQPNISIDSSGYLYFQWNSGDRFENTLNNTYYNYNFTKGHYNNLNLMLRFNNNSEIKKTDPFSVIAKYDLAGNLLWHKEADYVYTKSIIANNDGNIYGLARFNNLAAFRSADGNNQMITTKDSCNQLLFYSYDGNGNFLWGKTFNPVANGCQYPGELLKKDTCNNNLYFSAGFDTTVTFAGKTYSQTTKMNIFKFSPDGSCSEINCITTSTLVTDIKNNIAQVANNFKVTPNPNKGQFNIHSNSKEELFIQIYNSTGQLVLETTIQPGISEIMFDIPNSGVYYIMAKGKTIKEGQKILVIH